MKPSEQFKQWFDQLGAKSYDEYLAAQEPTPEPVPEPEPEPEPEPTPTVEVIDMKQTKIFRRSPPYKFYKDEAGFTIPPLHIKRSGGIELDNCNNVTVPYVRLEDCYWFCLRNCHDIEIDTLEIEKSAVGFRCYKGTSNIHVRRLISSEAVDTYGSGSHLNGDGFVFEADCSDITIDYAELFDNTDCGGDCKANNVLIKQAHAYRNQQGFKLWGTTTIEEVVAEDNKNYAILCLRGDHKVRKATFRNNKSCHVRMGWEQWPWERKIELWGTYDGNSPLMKGITGAVGGQDPKGTFISHMTKV